RRAAAVPVVALAGDEDVDVTPGLDELGGPGGDYVGYALTRPHGCPRLRQPAGAGEVVGRQVAAGGHGNGRALAEHVAGRAGGRGGRVARGDAPDREPLGREPGAGGEVAACDHDGSVGAELAGEGGLAPCDVRGRERAEDEGEPDEEYGTAPAGHRGTSAPCTAGRSR